MAVCKEVIERNGPLADYVNKGKRAWLLPQLLMCEKIAWPDFILTKLCQVGTDE